MTVILDNGETLDALPNDAATAAHVVRIEGNADLRGYAHPLPALRRIDGWAILRDYAHALPPGLTVGGWLDLSGCTALTALPVDLTVGGRLDLRGCTGLDHLCVGTDARGYRFYPVPMRGGVHVVAGCRNFSAAQARAHWPEGTECRKLAERCLKGDVA